MKRLLPRIVIFLSFLNMHGIMAQDSRLSIAADGPLLDNRTISANHFELEQNSPNPFDVMTEISFTSAVVGFVEFKIVNLIGKEVIRQVMEAEPGRNTIRIDGSDFMPGVYVYSLSNGSQTLTRRMVISKK